MSVSWNLGRFPFVRTGWPDLYLTSQLANEIGFFQRVLAEKSSPSCILFRIWLIWLIVLIKSEILISTGTVWPVSSDKWKAPLEMKFWGIKGRMRERKGCGQKILDEKIGAPQKPRTSYQLFIHMTKCKMDLFAKHFLGYTSSHLIHNKYGYCAFS